MARLRRAARLETREARKRLEARQTPYWKQLELGIALGYRRNKTGSGTWVLRRFVEGKYSHERLAGADDYDDANGIETLDYKQAHRKAIGQADNSAVLARDGINSDYTVAAALGEYMAWYAIQRKGAEIVQHSVDAHIIAKLGKRRVGDLTTKEIRTWHQGLAKGRERSTANRVLTILRAALNRAWEDGHVASADTWRRVKPFRGADAAKARSLSADECRRLLNSCEPDFRDLVHGALLTGCRYGELGNLVAADYTPDAGTLTIRDSKSGKPRHVPLTDEGRALFDIVTAGHQGGDLIFTKADGTPWARHHQVRRIRDACARAKIDPPANFHALRHTYGSLLAMEGVPLYVIASAMGHSDTRMTSRHYAHLHPSYVADTIRAHLPSFGGKKSNVKRLRKG